MLRDKLLNAHCEQALEFLLVAVCLGEYLGKNAELNLLVYAERLDIKVACVLLDVNHSVADNGNGLRLAAFRFLYNIYTKNACVLNLHSKFAGDNISLIGEDFACKRCDNYLCGSAVYDSLGDAELLVVLVSSEAREVVSLSVEEQRVNRLLCSLNGSRLAGAQLSVNLVECSAVVVLFLCLCNIVVNGVLAAFDCRDNARVVAELLDKLFLSGKAEGAQERCCGELSVLVYADVEHIVRVHFKLNPSAAVGDNRRLVELLSALVVLISVVHTRGTHKLRYNDALGAVNNKRSAVGHQGQVAHVYLVFHMLARYLVVKVCGYMKAGSIGGVALLAFFDIVLRLLVKAEGGKGKLKLSV